MKLWQNNTYPDSRDICILMGRALTQNLKGKPWAVLNMPLEGLYSCEDVIGNSSPTWVLDESVIFKQGFLQKSLVENSKIISSGGRLKDPYPLFQVQ